MSRPSLSTERGHTGDPEIDAIWRRLREITEVIIAAPLSASRLLTEEPGGLLGSGLSFTAGTARSIPHGLGRRAKGVLEVYGTDVASAAHVGLRVTAHPAGKTSANYVTVTPAATGTCFLLVF